MDETPPIRKITLVMYMRRRGAPLYHCPWSYSDGINEVEKKKSCHEHKRHLLAYQEEDV